MSLYNLKKVAELLPEIEGLVKAAGVDDNFPTDSKTSTLLSYLEIQYLDKVANETVDFDDLMRVNKAVELYQLQKSAMELGKRLTAATHEKQAGVGDLSSEVKVAEAYFEGQLTGRVNIEKVASHAEQLYDQYEEFITSDEVKRYAGAGYLDKQASVHALTYRAKLTGNAEFAKLAKVILGSQTEKFDSDDVRLICHTVTQMDKKAGLQRDFYKEALITKEAALRSSLLVDLAGKQVPVESIIRFGKQRVGSLLGEDISNEMFRDESPMMIKQVTESLPRDIKRTLATLIK